MDHRWSRNHTDVLFFGSDLPMGCTPDIWKDISQTGRNNCRDGKVETGIIVLLLPIKAETKMAEIHCHVLNENVVFILINY